jgi:hypothetical protein
MNIDRIRRRLTGGFKPFILRTSDGREYDVPHPEFIFIAKFDVVVMDKEGEIDILDPAQIVSLHNVRTKNGSPTKK